LRQTNKHTHSARKRTIFSRVVSLVAASSGEFLALLPLPAAAAALLRRRVTAPAAQICGREANGW
jgi:hypothetical protein